MELLFVVILIEENNYPLSQGDTDEIIGSTKEEIELLDSF